MDPDRKRMMVEGFVAAFAKAAQVSNTPEEAITSDTREPSYMFLAAEWNRSSVSERAYLLAILFGREFDEVAPALRGEGRGEGQSPEAKAPHQLLDFLEVLKGLVTDESATGQGRCIFKSGSIGPAIATS